MQGCSYYCADRNALINLQFLWFDVGCDPEGQSTASNCFLVYTALLMTLISLSYPIHQLMMGKLRWWGGVALALVDGEKGWFGSVALAGDVRQLAKVNKLDLIHLAWSLVEALLLFSLLKDGCCLGRDGWTSFVVVHGRTTTTTTNTTPPVGLHLLYRTPFCWSPDHDPWKSHTMHGASSSSRGKAFPSSVSLRILTQIHTKL